MKYSSYFFLFFYLSYSSFSFAIDLTLYEGEAYWDKVDALDWKEGPLTINHTNQGKVKLKKGEVALINDDAKQIMYWINGVQFTSTLYITTDYSSYTDYRYVNEGYVKLDDWEDVNADKFIKQLRDDSKEGNKIRAENNMPTVERMEWITEPTLNRLKNSSPSFLVSCVKIICILVRGKTERISFLILLKLVDHKLIQPSHSFCEFC